MSFPYFEFIIVFSILQHVFTNYLDLRQHRRFKVTVVPERLKPFVTEKEFQDTQSYNLAKSSFGLFTSNIDFLITMSVLWFGVYVKFWDWSGDVVKSLGFSSEILQSLVFSFSFFYVQTLLGMPFSLYRTFVIEQKFGFNKMTYKTFFLDHIKVTILSIVLGGPIISAMIVIIQWGGEYFWLYVWMFVTFVLLLMTTIYPTLIAPLFNKFTELEEGELRTRIENLASKVSFPLTKLFKVDGSSRSAHSNAYFYGFFKNKRIVLYDTLMEHATTDDIVAIVAHELGHYKLNHTIRNLAISLTHILVFFYLFGLFMNNNDLYASFGFDSRPILIGLTLFSQLFETLDSPMSLFMNSISRRFEYQADEFATNMGFDLTAGLVAIHKKNASNLNPDPWYSMYHFSHPTLVERITAIANSKKKLSTKSD